MIYRALLTGILLLVAACASVNVPNRWEQVPVAERGTLIGTMTAELSGATVMHYTLKYRNIQTKETASIQISPGPKILFTPVSSGDPELQESGKSMGVLFEASVPAGQYEIYEVALSYNQAALAVDSWSKPFSVPFNVEAGNVYYMGEFRGYPIERKIFLAPTQANGGYFVWRENRERDVEIWKKRHPDGDVASIRTLPLEIQKEMPHLRLKPLPPFASE